MTTTESGPDWQQRHPDLVQVKRQPAGVDFYRVDWVAPKLGAVQLVHGNHSFVIDNALSVLSMHDLQDFSSEGLYEFNINAGISAPSLIPHDEARLKTYALLQRILDAGWQQVIERSEPRLAGKARQDYMFATTNLNGLDATYMPTFEEWMRIQSRTPWSFYASGIYMDVTFTREATLTAPNKPGAYMLTFNIKTETEYLRGYAGPDDRLRWKEVVPAELEKAAKERARREADLRAQGIPIDESYRDPPLPHL